jgi:hypothetical protein
MSLTRIDLIAIIGSIFLIIIILELIRRNYLKERYSLLWLTTGGVFLILSLAPGLLSTIAKCFGFQIAANALFLSGMIFLVIIALGMTVAISFLSEKNKVLTQELVLLKKRVEDLEKKEGVEVK